MKLKICLEFEIYLWLKDDLVGINERSPSFGSERVMYFIRAFFQSNNLKKEQEIFVYIEFIEIQTKC